MEALAAVGAAHPQLRLEEAKSRTKLGRPYRGERARNRSRSAKPSVGQARASRIRRLSQESESRYPAVVGFFPATPDGERISAKREIEIGEADQSAKNEAQGRSTGACHLCGRLKLGGADLKGVRRLDGVERRILGNKRQKKLVKDRKLD